MKKYAVPKNTREIAIVDGIPYALVAYLTKNGDDWVVIKETNILKEIKDGTSRS